MMALALDNIVEGCKEDNVFWHLICIIIVIKKKCCERRDFRLWRRGVLLICV